jgi:hypothetical protein
MFIEYQGWVVNFPLKIGEKVHLVPKVGHQFSVKIGENVYWVPQVNRQFSVKNVHVFYVRKFERNRMKFIKFEGKFSHMWETVRNRTPLYSVFFSLLKNDFVLIPFLHPTFLFKIYTIARIKQFIFCKPSDILKRISRPLIMKITRKLTW